MPSLTELLKPHLFAHRASLSKLPQDDETKSEIELVDECLAAPSRPFVVNFIPQEEEFKSSEGKVMGSMSLKD